MKIRLIVFISTFPICVALSGQRPNTIDSLVIEAKKAPDTAACKLLFDAGNLYYLKGMNDSAIYYFNQSLEKAQKGSDQKKINEIKLAIVKSLIKLQKFDEGTKILFECIKAGEEEPMPAITGTAKSIVAFVYNYQGKEREALTYALEAEGIFTSIRDTAGLLFVYPILVTALGRNKDTLKALSYFDPCMRVFDIYGKSSTVIASDKEHLPLKRMAFIFNSVNLMEKRPDLLRALDEVGKVNEIISKRGNPYEKFQVATLISVINLKLKDFKKARNYAETAAGFIRAESRNYDQLRDIYQVIAEASDSLGEYEKAYAALLVYRQYTDSVFKTSSLEAIHTVEAKYETEKKEQKITALNKEKKSQRNLFIVAVVGALVLLLLLLFVLRSKQLQKKLFIKEQESQKAELEKRMYELEQTALRAQMNPHFIFNCLNSVQRFVGKDERNDVNRYLTTFASLIRQTLENSGKTLISLKDELEYLDTYIKVEQMRSRDNFDYDIQVADGIDTSGILIPNMLVQPLVENSIKHGLGDNTGTRGKLRLAVSKKNKLILTIEDNGPGINRAVGQLINPGLGHRAMGSSLTEKRIELYNTLNKEKISLVIGNISDTDKSLSGTRVRFEFPVETL